MVERASTAFEKLTPREREILRLIAAHLQSKEIARALGLSPKTVEMHVLSARRRLSGMSRRDAALAFVAWEGGDPGNDYRKRPDALAALPDAPFPDQEIGSRDDLPAKPGELEPGTPRGRLRSVLFGTGSEDPDVGPTPRDWRHEMTNLQWIGLVVAIAATIAVALAVAATGVHQFMLAVEKITGR